MAITPEFLDQIRSRISLSTVVGGRVKLTRKGNSFWGCCPFHSEKTPSFTVSDDKEFYHCFGCSEHGDIFTFVMKTQGITFVESVSQLAAQAGLQMPRISPEQRQQQQHRLSLYEVCETACDFFQKNLHSQLGQPTMAYLKKRGVSAADIQYFRLGYSGDSQSFLDYMQSKNIDTQALLDTGLARQGNTGIYGFFRNRLMFPITDTRGRVVAFGGRFMGDEKQAQVGKYINSPQGTLYDKSRVLYNLKNARETAYKHNRLVVCEGYMDVIALHRAGFCYAIAPCGTAMTEQQLIQCWKTVDEPILCFDGDTAGKKAALKTVERALPLLRAGKSVNIAMMPGGQDPDDIIRTQGAKAMSDILDAAVLLRDFLWNHAVQSFETNTPERLAKMEKQLFAWAAQIDDSFLAKSYRYDFGNLVWDTFKRNRKEKFVSSNKGYLKHIRLWDIEQKRLLACFLNHPKVLADYEESFIGFFDNDWNTCFQCACDAVQDGVETAEKMHLYFANSPHKDLLASVCNPHVYMGVKRARPQVDDTETAIYVQGVLDAYNVEKCKAHTQQQINVCLQNDQVEKIDPLGASYRVQEHMLYADE